MRTYLLRRVLLAIPTLILVTIIVFLLVRFIPGSVLDMMIAEMSSTSGEQITDVQGLKRALGMDVSIPVQYGRWLGVLPNPIEGGKFSGMFQLNLGRSLWTNESINDILRQRIPVSLELSILSHIFQWGLALPVGVFASTRQDSLIDYSARIFAITMLSVPGFWLATMVIVYPSIWWGTMPNIVYTPLVVDPWGNIKQFILAAFITGIAGSAGMMRLTRTMMLEVLRQDYIRTAWSKGLNERAVLIKHAVKNAFIPVVTVMGAQIPTLISGQIIMEQIFALPGMGRAFITALNQRDYPIISAINTIIATLVMFANILVDISYAWLDPRIRYN
jgi:peptide/nickel transport system permease protein